MRHSTEQFKEDLDSLRTRDVQQYLTSRNWFEVEDESTTAASVYRKRDDDAEVLLPLRRSLADYSLRMADVVQTLAAVEQKSTLEIINRLSGPPGDILKLRIVSPEAMLGHLPLAEALRLLQGGRDLLLSAACSESRPRAFHPEKTLKEANDFIKDCRLGQTERGSFVATIITPVPPMLDQQSALSGKEFQEVSEPYARRVTTRLMTGLGLANRAIKTNHPGLILDGVDQGISANLCEAVALMGPAGVQSRIDIEMNWSLSRPSLPLGVPGVVSFAQEDFLILSEAGRKLRERSRPHRERFEGSIFSLQADPGSLYDDIAGKIVVRTKVGGEPARIKFVLNHDDYRLACDAHRDNRQVAISGVIHHDVKVRVYELAEPSDFRVIDPV